MAENEENGNGNEQLTEEVSEGASGVTDRATSAAKGLAGGNGVPKKVWIPAAVAAATAAAGYAAARGTPKLKDTVKDSAVSKAEDAAQGTLSRAEQQGGITGLAAKMMRKGTGDGGGGGMMSGVAEAVTSKLGGGGKEPSAGWGKGRRNPIQRWVDVAVPLQTAYDQWTQFEEFPKFMHRVERIEQKDPTHVIWHEKIWFSRRQWEAEITEQIPDKIIAWRTVSGTSHVGHVTFHQLDDELTRVMVNIDFNPSGLFEKMASGLRFAKRAAESDLCRFKAFIETHGEATGAWRGRIEEGEVVRDAKAKEGKPLEEGKELHTPEGVGEEKKPKRGEDGDSSESDGRAETQRGEGEAGDEDDEREAQRQEREQRREERRKQLASS